MAELFLGGPVDPAMHERVDGGIRIGTDTFTTHGVIVGMTGSGKTGLGVVLIEEVLRAGLPALLIDPKGDLTNLCLTFPELRPADFRPWIDDAQARAAGVSSDEFAAQQSQLWTEGLAGWGIGPGDVAALRASTDFTIYTPGSRSGVPINIVGSLQVPVGTIDTSTIDDEVIGDEIEGYVSGLLGLVGIEADPLSSREHILLSNLIAHSWQDGLALDLPTLVGMVARPPIRKLGVFELDQFFPPDDRMTLAMKLNGLLASPSFAAWGMGSALDIQSLLYTAGGRARCAIVTTAHLSDEERQFVTALMLSKLVTWMRRQSGTTDLRALLYIDEVAGYLPPTANPPTKKPIMLLMKQARAFGVGVVLTTQNPVDVDYKALSNAGTWMIGRLQTDRDKQRLLDGMSSASGGVDVGTIGDTISGLAKREFVLRRAGKDEPEVFTTRWAMSYLRGPLTRDQIASLTADALDPSVEAADAADGRTGSSILNDAIRAPTSSATPPATPGDVSPETNSVSPSSDVSPVMPEVASGVPVRWVDVAAPWLGDVGGDARGTLLAPAIVARLALRYDESKADLVHDAEYEVVIFPLDDAVAAGSAVPVDHDDRDLLADAPATATYRLVDAPIASKAFFSGIQRDLVDHLTRSLALDLPTNVGLKLYARPGEALEAFETRCAQHADELADAEIAKLRDKYESKATTLRRRIESAEDRADVLAEEAAGKRNSELLSTAGSILGGLLGGRRSRGGLVGSVLGKAGTAAARRGRSRASEERVEAAQNKAAGLVADLEDLEAELAEELTEIDTRWAALAKDITTTSIALERSDVKVTELVVAWVPVT